MENFAIMAAENPFGFGYLLNTIYLYLQNPTEITILNPQNKEISEYITKNFLPESILVSVQNPSQLDGLAKYQFFSGKEFEKDTTVFVCRNFSCSLPLKTVKEIDSLLF